MDVNIRTKIWLCWHISKWNISACFVPACVESGQRRGFFIEFGPASIELVSKLGCSN